jgi:dynein heavy chain
MYLSKAHEAQEEDLPWDTLRYLIGEAMYGGRVTDNYDRRIVTCYLLEYLGEFIFDSNQKFVFAKSPAWEYLIPDEETIEQTLEFIEKIPLFTPPNVFGLHSNAEISYYTNATKGLWAGMLAMQTSEGAGAEGVNRDDVIL